MKISKFLFPGVMLLLLLFVSACRKETSTDSLVTTEELAVEYSAENPVQHDPETRHTDSQYKYEFRSGESGDYKYHYDLTGTDADGNSVSGAVDVDGKYGNGVIEDADGNEVEVSVEWVGQGELKAEDSDGNVWDLKVE